MAVSVINSPTTPNVTGTKLVYSVIGSNVNQPQFQYVTDIYESGSSELLTRLYTYPNLQGPGIIDVARVLDDNLDYDNYWKITGSIAPQESVKTFDIRFGEAYGTSISSSVTIYTGSTPNYLEVFPGIVDANQGSFDFPSSSFEGTGSAYLTNHPSAVSPLGYGDFDYGYLVDSTDYFTVTTYQDTNITPASITVRGYKLESGSISFVTSSIIPLPSTEGRFDTIGLGPKNLSEWDSGWANYISSGSINHINTINDPGGLILLINDNWDGIPYNGVAGNFSTPFTLKPQNCEYTRFAFINKYGFWDYYNVYNPLRKLTNVDRKIYEQNYVDYSSIQSIYSQTKRGETQYNTGYTDTFEITTTYLDKPMADWLTEMFDSPDVYVQSNGEFVPINITNTYERE
jgi:hypothetical protein